MAAHVATQGGGGARAQAGAPVRTRLRRQADVVAAADGRGGGGAWGDGEQRARRRQEDAAAATRRLAHFALASLWMSPFSAILEFFLYPVVFDVCLLLRFSESLISAGISFMGFCRVRWLLVGKGPPCRMRGDAGGGGVRVQSWGKGV